MALHWKGAEAKKASVRGLVSLSGSLRFRDVACSGQALELLKSQLAWTEGLLSPYLEVPLESGYVCSLAASHLLA